MPSVRKVPPTTAKSSREAQPSGKPARKHPLLLALASIAIVLWLGFLAWLAFRK